MAGSSNRFISPAIAVIWGAALGTAFLFPETAVSAAAGWLWLILTAVIYRRCSSALLFPFLGGVLAMACGFYWLVHTISFFGGFALPLSLLLFALFCAICALQFVLVGILYRRLSAFPLLNHSSAALPLAWLAVDVLFPKIFPWAIAHTQLRWTAFSVLAEFFGVCALSAVLVWFADLLVSAVESVGNLRKQKLIVFFVSLGAVQIFGTARVDFTNRLLADAPHFAASLVQGNLDAKQKGDVHYLVTNIARYRSLSEQAQSGGTNLLIWPESVMNLWVPESITEVRGTPADPFPDAAVPVIYGGLSYRPVEAGQMPKRFNTGFAIDQHGEVRGFYEKRVLMPFGEYMPFAGIFPALKELSPQTADFTAGDHLDPIALTVNSTGAPPVELKAALLICYEDLVPAISREGIVRGANLLVNLTNDAWYGDTAAPFEHHLLAMFRAIETKRYLLRVTNTGYTAVVDPLGKTVASLPLFNADYLTIVISPLDYRTLYSRLGDVPVLLLAVLTLLMALKKRRPPNE